MSVFREEQAERKAGKATEKRQSALRGGLHVKLVIDSYGEVIDRFGLRLAMEPPSLLTSRLDTLSIRLRSSAPRFGPCLKNRAGLDLCAGP